MASQFPAIKLIASALLSALAWTTPVDAAESGDGFELNQELNLRHRKDFEVTRFADHALTGSIRHLTLNAKGEVVVAGRGEIKTILDTDDDGVADEVRTFASIGPEVGGICFEGADLYYAGDGWFSRFLDSNADGVADGPAQRLFPLPSGERGAHSVRKGPDGAWYVIMGNAPGLSPQAWNYANTPIRNPEGGVLLAISPDLSRSEVVAEGFFNPYDFAWTEAGDVFTVDNALSADLFLPWNLPPRLMQIAHGQHHGWRPGQLENSRPRPDYYPDSVPALWTFGPGVFRGVEAYRHHRFPVFLRNSLFACDWSNGRILSIQLKPMNAGQVVQVETFAETAGNNGFAPIDVVVDTDGSLLVAAGGESVSGGIYRFEYTKRDPVTGKPPDQPEPFMSPFDRALRAPQRSAAWSRSNWMPIAGQSGRELFEGVLVTLKDTEQSKLVAVEVLTEIFGGLGYGAAKVGSMSPHDSVRARTAWSLGRIPCENFLPLLQRMSFDQSARVRVAALNALLNHVAAIPSSELYKAVTTNLGHEDQRVQLVAARLAARLQAKEWADLEDYSKSATPIGSLYIAMAGAWRHSDRVYIPSVQAALKVLGNPEKGTPLLGMTAVRVLMLTFGDWSADSSLPEVFHPYQLGRPHAQLEPFVARTLETIKPLFPTGNALLDAELARLLAMLECPDPAVFERMKGAFSVNSSAMSDFHYLNCLVRLNPPPQEVNAAPLSEVLLWFDNKLVESDAASKRQWRRYLRQTVNALFERYPTIQKAVAGHRQFPDPKHGYLVEWMDEPSRSGAVERLWDAAQKAPGVPWSDELIEVLGTKDDGELRDLLLEQWQFEPLRPAIIRALSNDPQEEDVPRFELGAGADNLETAARSLAALTRLESDQPDRILTTVMAQLHRAVRAGDSASACDSMIAWIETHYSPGLSINRSDDGFLPPEMVYRPAFHWFERTYPDRSMALKGATADENDFWKTQIADAPWQVGRAVKGRRIFEERRCVDCHERNDGPGPVLRGVADRLPAQELMNAILWPALSATPGYEVVSITLQNGAVHEGMVIHESPGVLLMRKDLQTTVRILTGEVVSRTLVRRSLMPGDLMKGTNGRDLSDLYAYLKTL